MQEKGNYFGDKGLDGERGRVECRSREWVLRAGGRTHCEGRGGRVCENEGGC